MPGKPPWDGGRRCGHLFLKIVDSARGGGSLIKTNGNCRNSSGITNIVLGGRPIKQVVRSLGIDACGFGRVDLAKEALPESKIEIWAKCKFLTNYQAPCRRVMCWGSD